MGALADTIKTLNKLRKSFLSIAKQFSSCGMHITNPKITDDGFTVAEVYPGDRLGRRLHEGDKYVFKVKWRETERGYCDVQFIKEDGTRSDPIKGPLTMRKMQDAFERYRNEAFPDLELTDFWQGEWHSDDE